MNTFTFQVSDMNCGHCKAKIEKALTEKVAPVRINIDLSTKSVVVETAFDTGAVFQAIAGAGYTPLAAG